MTKNQEYFIDCVLRTTDGVEVSNMPIVLGEMTVDEAEKEFTKFIQQSR